MLEPIRQYARQRLGASGKADEVSHFRALDPSKSGR
jgi:hypothetical protein